MHEEVSFEQDTAELSIEYPEGGQADLQHQYEEHVKEDERRLREAERLAKLGHWELDFTTQKLHWSAETFRILGLDPLDLEPSFDIFLSMVHPNDREYVEQQYMESVEKHTQYNVYHRIILKSGAVKFVNERCRTYYNELDEPERSLGTILDMTDHERHIGKLVKAKAGLEIYAQGLEEEIEQLADQLILEKEELAKARELIRTLKNNL